MRKRRGRRRALKFRLKKESLLSTSAVLCLLLSALTFLSFFAQAAAINAFWQQILNRFFGWGVIFVPFLLGLLGLVLLRTIKLPFLELRVVFGLFLFTLSFLGLSHLFFGGPSPYEKALMGEGGGILGYTLSALLKKAISPFGAFLVLLSGLVVSFLIIFNTSLDQVILLLGKILKGGKEFLESYIFKNLFAIFGKEKPKKEEVEEEVGEKVEEKKEPEFEIVPSLAEPLGLKKEKPKLPLSEETVVNLPFSDQVWEYPSLDLLSDIPPRSVERGDVKRNAQIIEKTLESFGVRAKVVEVNMGPAVTQYALDAAEGTKIARITNLQNDLAMALASPTGSVRIEAPIPGKSLLGIEVPNYSLNPVSLKSVLTSERMQSARSKLTIILGKDVAGQAIIDDIGRMPHVLIAGATGSGKTCSADTYLFTEKGIVTFRELCPLPLNSEVDFRIKVATRDGIEKTSKTYNNGICDFFKIETAQGFAVEVTAEHPLWVIGENGEMQWRGGDEIKEGDCLALSRGDNIFGSKIDLSNFKSDYKNIRRHTPTINFPKSMTPDLGTFLGLLTADGGLTIGSRVVFTQVNLTLLSLYENLLEKLFGIKSLRKAKSGQSDKAKDVILGNRYLKDFLLFLGMTKERAPKKEVPLSIRQAPREVVVAFLRALFECDAYIGPNNIELTLASEVLTRQAQLLLLNLGIVSSLHIKRVKKYKNRTYWRLAIHGEELRNFVKIIGFIRSENYTKLKDHMRRSFNPNNDLVPNTTLILQNLKDKYRNRFASLTNRGWNYQEGFAIPKYDYTHLKEYNRGARMPSYETVKRILTFYEPIFEEPEYQSLLEVWQKHFYWSKVTKITRTKGEGYDFEVPGSNSFVGNGFVNHNSILIHSFVSTLLFRSTPLEVKFILVDPKRVELPQYNGIPHLLTPVIVEPEKALPSLKWAISEMERRYRLFESTKARNINAYNELSGFQALPYILIIVDELADLMVMAPVEVEKSICRLAQMSRATGIHLILATQRPSVDVLTGLIKANIPCRVAFATVSQVDSRVIIDQPGAEKLLGRGDMLYVPPDASKPMRIQGVFVSDKELSRLIDFLRKSPIKPEYKEEVTEFIPPKKKGKPQDELFPEAVKVICTHKRASASLLQRRLSIGYARAARLLDELEERGIVSPQKGSKPRDVLIRDPEQALKGIEP